MNDWYSNCLMKDIKTIPPSLQAYVKSCRTFRGMAFTTAFPRFCYDNQQAGVGKTHRPPETLNHPQQQREQRALAPT